MLVNGDGGVLDLVWLGGVNNLTERPQNPIEDKSPAKIGQRIGDAFKGSQVQGVPAPGENGFFNGSIGSPFRVYSDFM